MGLCMILLKPVLLSANRCMEIQYPQSIELCHCCYRWAAAQAALDARNARYRLSPGRQSTDEEEAAERVKGRIEQAERAVEKFVTRRLKAVQPGLQKV